MENWGHEDRALGGRRGGEFREKKYEDGRVEGRIIAQDRAAKGINKS